METFFEIESFLSVQKGLFGILAPLHSPCPTAEEEIPGGDLYAERWEVDFPGN